MQKMRVGDVNNARSNMQFIRIVMVRRMNGVHSGGNGALNERGVVHKVQFIRIVVLC